MNLPRLMMEFSLQKIELFRALNGCPPVIHPKLAVNVFGVGTHGVQENHELAGNLPLVYWILVILVLIIQARGICRSVITFRSWGLQPESRPRGLSRMVWHIVLPLILNLVWAFVLLIGVPTVLGGYPLSFLRYATPDLGYFISRTHI